MMARPASPPLTKNILRTREVPAETTWAGTTESCQIKTTQVPAFRVACNVEADEVA